MKKIKDHSLYLIISEEYGCGRSAIEIADIAITGGVDMIQMREKNKPREELIRLGRELAGLSKKSGGIFIVNDDPVLAMEAGADGVHLGQEDLKKIPLNKAREIMERDKIVGVSTHSVKEFEKANADDVDYIAYGPIFTTKTKDYFLGTADVKEVLRIARKPVFLIGGINLSNIDELLAKGAKNIALIRGITESEDVLSAARGFKEKVMGQKEDAGGRSIAHRR